MSGMFKLKCDFFIYVGVGDGEVVGLLLVEVCWIVLIEVDCVGVEVLKKCFVQCGDVEIVEVVFGNGFGLVLFQ